MESSEKEEYISHCKNLPRELLNEMVDFNRFNYEKWKRKKTIEKWEKSGLLDGLTNSKKLTSIEIWKSGFIE